MRRRLPSLDTSRSVVSFRGGSKNLNKKLALLSISALRNDYKVRKPMRSRQET
jgi:hypothetical protein